MSSGKSNPTPHVTDKERAKLDKIRSEPRFVRAYRKYTRTIDHYHVPYLAGSNTSGTTVYFDPLVPNSTKPFIAEHEKTEGVLIREYEMPYEEAHKYATESERSLVESTLGINWKIYQEKLAGPISRAEKAPRRNLPPDLLQAAYNGDPDEATKRLGSSRDDRTERDDL